ncbi:MAG: heme ABC transporter ATP-binding protein [Pseudomonadota bacterium]
MSLLEAQSVSYTVRERALLSEVSLAVSPGELVALLGPNGAGKSTFLRLLAGELAPASGTVCLDGEALAGMSLDRQASRRAVMTQASGILFDFTVDEVLRMGWAPNRWLGEEALARAQAWVIEQCDLSVLLGRLFNSLSGGEQQRVQFARALMQVWPSLGTGDEARDPRYLLLDEPTASLDLAHELLLMSTVARLCREHRLGVVAVVHDLNLAARFADRIALLAAGRLQRVGTPAQVLEPALLSRVYDVSVHVTRLEADERLLVTT